MSSKTIVVCDAGGFIGGHLVRWLKTNTSAPIRAVDVKPLHEWYQRTDGVNDLSLDLQRLDACRSAVAGAGTVYNLAADMGGMGFIENNKAICMLSVLIHDQMRSSARHGAVA